MTIKRRKRFPDEHRIKDQSPDRPESTVHFEKLINVLEKDKDNFTVKKRWAGVDKSDVPYDIFYQSKEMLRQYVMYNEFVFIHRRMSKTLFCRNLLLICGVNNEGRTIVFGVALIKEDVQEGFKFAVSSFLQSVSEAPRSIIIERLSTLKASIETILKDYPSTKLLYCNNHLQKSLKFQIKQLMQTRDQKLSDSVKNLMIRVEKLPKRDGVAALKKELEECRALSQNETCKRQCGEIAIIVEKIAKES